jgi:hypothetical protein
VSSNLLKSNHFFHKEIIVLHLIFLQQKSSPVFRNKETLDLSEEEKICPETKKPSYKIGEEIHL